MKFVILFSILFLISGCASYEITKKYYSKDPNHQYSGGILHFGVKNKDDKNGDQDKIDSLIINFCENRNYRKISIENSPELIWFLIYPIGHLDYKLEFECLK